LGGVLKVLRRERLAVLGGGQRLGGQVRLDGGGGIEQGSHRRGLQPALATVGRGFAALARPLRRGEGQSLNPTYALYPDASPIVKCSFPCALIFRRLGRGATP